MSDQVGASHILIMHKDSDRSSATRTKDQALELINEIKGKLDGGAEFSELASENSDCPSGQQGGSLGQFGRGQMVKAFEDSAFGLEHRGHRGDHLLESIMLFGDRGVIYGVL